MNYVLTSFKLYLLIRITLVQTLTKSEDVILPKILKELEELTQKTKEYKLEFFGKNITKNKVSWQFYYDCMDRMFEATMKFRTLPPKSLTALEGTTVKIPCLICVPPIFAETTPSWFRFDSPVLPDEWILIDRKTGDMSIFGVRLEEAGRYECRLGRASSRVYFLHVVSSEAELRLVKGRNNPKGPKAMLDKPLNVPGYPGLVLFTEWARWTQCSRCGNVGLRYRFGSCSVRLDVGQNAHSQVVLETTKPHSLRLRSKYYTAQRRWYKQRQRKIAAKANAEITTFAEFPNISSKHTTVNPSKVRTTKLEGTTEPIKQEDYLYFLKLFFEGLPCGSPLLPKEIKYNGEVKSRKNEMMEGFCKTPCADEFFEVKDWKGNVIEKANNSAGIFSVLQGPPAVPPMPSRETYFAPVFEPIIIVCPGHMHADVPFYWTVNRTNRLIPGLLANQTKGRVTINFRQELVFREVEPEDAKLYACWQAGSLAGVVRLVPFDPAAVKFDHHLMLLGVTVILGTFVYLFTRIFMNRKRAATVD